MFIVNDPYNASNRVLDQGPDAANNRRAYTSQAVKRSEINKLLKETGGQNS